MMMKCLSPVFSGCSGLLMAGAMFLGGTTVQAEPPVSLNGRTLQFQTTAGAKYWMAFNDSASAYRLFSVTAGLQSDSAGTFSYQRLNTAAAQFFFNDSLAGNGFVTQLSFFGNTQSGAYQTVHTNGGAAIEGFFFSYNGAAPLSMGNKVVQMLPSSGIYPFASLKKFRFACNGSGGFVREFTPGYTEASGTFSYVKTNRSSGYLALNDEALGPIHTVFTYISATNGLYLLRDNSGAGYQLGQFVMTDLTAPRITAQPTNRTVTVGNATTFRVTAKGTAPLFYQWYKGDGLIGDATNSSYSLPLVTSEDSGNYRVVVRNSAGTLNSQTAFLNAVCSYSLNQTNAFFDFRGGTNLVYVTTSEYCGVGVTNTNAWVTISTNSSGGGFNVFGLTVATNDTVLPRTARLLFGNRTYTVIQGRDFTGGGLSGKTLLLATPAAVSNRFDAHFRFAGLSSGNVHVAFYGITNGVNYTNDTFTYQAVSPTEALVTTPLYGDLSLSFTSPTAGYYTLGGGPLEMSGTFAVTPSAPDYNFDGLGDIPFQSSPARALSAWFFKGTNYLSSRSLRGGKAPATGWKFMAQADLNLDGFTDAILQHDGGKVAVWLLQGTNTSYLASVTLHDNIAANVGWRIIGTGDFNSDGQKDLLFRQTSGALGVWYLSGTNYLGTGPLSLGKTLGSTTRVVGVADYNRDGQDDVLLQTSDWKVLVWYFNGTQFVSSEYLRGGKAAPVNRKATGLADFDFDGKLDIVLQDANNKLRLWLMDGLNLKKDFYLRKGTASPTGVRAVGPK